MDNRFNWDRLEWDAVTDRIRRKVFHGANCSIVLVELNEDAPVHTHHHEQLTTILSGSGEFMVGGEGVLVGPGDMLHMPPHMPHGVRIVDAPLVVTDTFVPCREEFAASKRI
ncbi:MAG: cupin domain-containing protein [Desulfovibrionaceae bacterium]